MIAIACCLWSETGVQIRGRRQFGEGPSLSYAVYAVNGLEEDPSFPDTDLQNIREAKDNDRDRNDSDKAVGYYLSLEPFDDLRLGNSLYTGTFSPDGHRRLEMWEFDASYLFRDLGGEGRELELLGEYVYASQERAADTNLRRKGGYLQASYKLFEQWEPVVRYDSIDMGLAKEFNATGPPLD